MTVNHALFACPPERVFEVLAEGWLLPGWVVGASRMRAVDAAWPTPGSALPHSVNVWPKLIDDSTSMGAWDPPRHALFITRGWPLGAAHRAIDVRSRDSGSGCPARLTEHALAGPAHFVPRFLATAGLLRRDTETRRRLRFLAEGGA